MPHFRAVLGNQKDLFNFSLGGLHLVTRSRVKVGLAMPTTQDGG